MEEGAVQRISGMPTDLAFWARTEAGNLPVVLVGGLVQWPALSRWNPVSGGLRYLKVALLFGSFIDAILSRPEGSTTASAAESTKSMAMEKTDPSYMEKLCTEPDEIICSSAGDHLTDRGGTNLELYLAQPSMVDADNISNVNLWMSMADSRSSTHYDPYHNILCVVAGEKKVTLWPPSAAPYLYPLPIHGEASNHSGVDIGEPDYTVHPLFNKALVLAKRTTLHPGDALFIPEGWYHQVDNIGVTIGVNFWWPSKISSAFGTHMDAYYLRRLISSLVDEEKKRMLRNGKEECTRESEAQLIYTSPGSEDQMVRRNSGKQCGPTIAESIGASDTTSRNPPGNESLKLVNLSDFETQNLEKLITVVSGKIETSPDMILESQRSQECPSQVFHGEANYQGVSYPDTVQADPVCRVLIGVGALSLQRILLVMAAQFPRTLQALVMNTLSPAAAELLTMKFEELDTSTENPYREDFYERFYSAFDEPGAVMASLLDKKEAFAAQVLRYLDCINPQCKLNCQIKNKNLSVLRLVLQFTRAGSLTCLDFQSLLEICEAAPQALQNVMSQFLGLSLSSTSGQTAP